MHITYISMSLTYAQSFTVFKFTFCRSFLWVWGFCYGKIKNEIPRLTPNVPIFMQIKIKIHSAHNYIFRMFDTYHFLISIPENNFEWVERESAAGSLPWTLLASHLVNKTSLLVQFLISRISLSQMEAIPNPWRIPISIEDSTCWCGTPESDGNVCL